MTTLLLFSIFERDKNRKYSYLCIIEKHCSNISFKWWLRNILPGLVFWKIPKEKDIQNLKNFGNILFNASDRKNMPWVYIIFEGLFLCSILDESSTFLSKILDILRAWQASLFNWDNHCCGNNIQPHQTSVTMLLIQYSEVPEFSNNVIIWHNL